MNVMRYFFVVLITICHLYPVASFGQYNGGEGDGHYHTQNTESTLNGRQLSATPLFFGGSGDGAVILKEEISLNGVNLMVIYGGGSGDGTDQVKRELTLEGIHLSVLYMGGSGDGADHLFNEFVINGTALAEMFRGGRGDGFSEVDTETILNGQTIVALYQGGAGDGADRSHEQIVLNGTNLASVFSGGKGDGANQSILNTILNGMELSLIYTGGTGDGATFTLYKGPLDIELPDSQLPIELLDFDVFKEGESVRIEWETLIEIDNDYFLIERTKNFTSIEPISQVFSNGNGEGHQYLTYDDSPFDGISYYRLKQVDFNGDFSFTDWKVVDFEHKDGLELSIFPNPSYDGQGILSVFSERNNHITEVQVFNANGQLIWRKPILNATSNSNEIHIDIGTDQSGTYFIKAFFKDNSERSLKWIVINPE
jgi:hypothetical protein